MSPVFATMPSPRLPYLVGSIREFGGELVAAPVGVFGDSVGMAGVEEFPIGMPAGRFPFAGKVAACAAAERLAAGKFDTLIWMDPECLVVNPPMLYCLAKPFGAAFRPVHIRNVGLQAGKRLDDYWNRIFEVAGEPDFDVEAYVDGQSVRAYFNTHAFSVDPNLGLLGRWARIFEGLAADEGFLSGPCSGSLRRVFLHQAVLSALAGSALGRKGIRILPPTYNYPYNLQGGIPEARRAKWLNDLVTVACEGRSLDPAGMDDIEVKGALRSWLSSRA
jgi:hypothetical protein